jgi:hypothetical protein
VDIGWIARKEAAMDTLVLVAWVALACYVISASLRWLLEGSAPRPLQSLVRLAERRRRAASLPSSATVVLLELELQRIAERLQQEYVSPQPAKAERVRVTSRSIGVIGLGTMGAGIAEVFARNGFDVVGVELNDESLERGRQHIQHSTARAVKRGKLTEAEQAELVGGSRFTTNLERPRRRRPRRRGVPESLDSSRRSSTSSTRSSAPRRSSPRTPPPCR